MSPSANNSDLSAGELAELSALADGTLSSARRPEVEAKIASSPRLRELYERELSVVAVLREARARDRAPDSLRAGIEAMRPAPVKAARGRVVLGGSLAVVLAAVALALVLILPSGTPGAPSVSQAASLAVRGPAGRAPAPDPSEPTKLGTEVEALYFPNWGPRFGWRAVGQRTDRIGGRAAVTVYYQWRAHRVAYTIVAAPSLNTPRAPVTTFGGTVFRTLVLDGRLVVTWTRAGHTCVLSSSGTPAAALRQLAAWHA